MDTKEEVLAAKPELVASGAETLAAGGALEGDFGLDDAAGPCNDRDFISGENVVIADHAVVQDKERRQEGWTDIEINPETGKRNPNYVPIKDRTPIEIDVKGCRGQIQSGGYRRESDGAWMVPVELAGVKHNEALVYVDERKLKRPGERPDGKSTIAIRPKMTAEDRDLAKNFTKYQAAQRAASLEGLSFPTFTDWLALQPPKN